MKKIFVGLLACLLVVLHVQPIKAKQEASIENLTKTSGIEVTSQSYQIQYEGKTARVFYGSNGIHIAFDNTSKTLDTTYAVMDLVVCDDLNSDGYVDFLTVQSSNDYTPQIYTISGKDGSELSHTHITREEYNSLTGKFDKITSSILLMKSEKNVGYFISDYDFYAIDLLTGKIEYNFHDKDNIWDFEIVEEKVFLVDQLGKLVVLNKETGKVLKQETIANSYRIEYEYDDSVVFKAQMNMWDVFYYNSKVFATSEDGRLYIIDKDSYQSKEIELNVIDEKIFNASLQYNIQYTYSGLKYNPSGITTQNYKNYKILCAKGDNLLIACYALDPKYKGYDEGSSYTNYVVFSLSKKEIVTSIALEQNRSYLDAIFDTYDNKEVITIMKSYNGYVGVSMYDFEGKQIVSNDNIFGMGNGTFGKLTRQENSYLFEIFNTTCKSVSLDLKEVNSIVDGITKDVSIIDDLTLVVEYKNGSGNVLYAYQEDYSTPLWKFTNPIQTSVNGIRNVSLDDYNMDGCKDVILLIDTMVNEYEMNTTLIILNGKDGSTLVNSKIFDNIRYDEKGRQYKGYHYFKEVKLIKDMNSDRKKEILMDESMIVSSKNFKVMSYINLYNLDGNIIEVGDINKDGFTDYVSVSDKSAVQFISKVLTGEVAYNQSKLSLKLNEKGENYVYASEFGDIDNDGIKEFIVNDFNDKNYQVFKVINGRTLKEMFTICPTGVSEYETYTVMDDLNNDGYNEIFGYTGMNYCNVLLDGKTGEVITYIESEKHFYYIFDDKKYYIGDGEYWHPEYIVTMGPTEAPCVVDDINNDGCKDFLISNSYYDYDNYRYMSAIISYSGKDGSEIKRMEFLNERGYDYTIRKIKGNNDLICLIYGNSSSIVNIKTGEAIATFDRYFNQAKYLDESHIAVLSGSQLYRINIDRAFTVLTDFSKEIKNNSIDLKWETDDEFAIMSIYDNTDLVTVTNDKNYCLKMLAGEHIIRMELTDSYGKSSIISYIVKVEELPNQSWWVYLGVIGIVAGALYLNIHHKALVNKKIKEELR